MVLNRPVRQSIQRTQPTEGEAPYISQPNPLLPQPANGVSHRSYCPSRCTEALLDLRCCWAQWLKRVSSNPHFVQTRRWLRLPAVLTP